MIKRIAIKDVKFAKQVLALQLLSYKVEAELINFNEILPLKDTVETLQIVQRLFMDII